jgi:hypothetical protein
MKKNIVVLDIGTHKAEEVWLFEGAPRITYKTFLTLLRGHGPVKWFFELLEINRLSRNISKNFNFRYVLVEPVVHKELLKFLIGTQSIFVGGVSSCYPSGPVQLLMAKDSLGNSIVSEKPGLTGELRETYNVNFKALYSFLIENFLQTGHSHGLLLRINAEGVEGPIIEYVLKTATKPLVIAGSLGDIKKCFGQKALDRTNAIIEDSRVPFVYLTSNPNTWSTGLRSIYIHLSQQLG